MNRRDAVKRLVATCVGALALSTSRAVRADMSPVDIVWIKKAENTLFLIRNGDIVRRYPIALGPNPRGHKRREGDGRTPEGLYYIEGRNPESQFHLGLLISYPNTRDSRRAAARDESPGGEIMIHGLPNGMSDDRLLKRNWTQGCVGMSNEHIREVWSLVADGTPVFIEP